MSSFDFFLGWLFASQKMREMLCISRPEFALQTRAFQGYVRTSCYLHSFATLRNWLRQPLLSLPRFVNQILKIEPNIYILHAVYNYESVAGAYCLVSPVTSKIRIHKLWAGFFLQEVFVLRASLL